MMKVVLLAGGLGTRLSEETEMKPKPMVEIGGKPILWHIMKHYAHHGFNEFVVALGYKGESIKKYFMEYHSLTGNMTVDLGNGQVSSWEKEEAWRIHLVDTGQQTLTGGRVRRLKPLLKDGTFMVTYGDGVSNVDLGSLLRFHREHGRAATLTSVRPPARFGGLQLDGQRVVKFKEKPQIGEGWINGGFLIFEPQIFKYLESDSDSLEANALERLADDGQLMAYPHDGFWQCMDTLRDRRALEAHWQDGKAPWKVWP